MPDSARQSSPRQIGRFRLLGELGRGGMAIVYRAFDPDSGTDVALKILPADKLDTAALVRFQREGRALQRLDHPNIVKVFDLGTEDGTHYLAMEYVDGRTLRSLIRRSGSLSPARTLEIVRQVCDALEYAHSREMIHRDIKSANIMMDPTGCVKLMDFGLVQVTGMTLVTQTGSVMGTPEYMSPEQVSGDDVDSRSDIYSLGITMYEMLAGRPPFEASNAQAVTMMQKYDEPRPVQELDSGIPEIVASIVSRALAKDPADRYAGAAELREDVQKAIRQLEGVADPIPATDTGSAAVVSVGDDILEGPPGPGEAGAIVGDEPLAVRLLHAGVASKEQLQEAVRSHSETGRDIRTLLVDARAVAPDVMAAFTAQWAGCETFQEGMERGGDADLARFVPERLTRMAASVPLDRRGDAVRVAMVNPLDPGARDDMRMRLGSEIEPVHVTREQFQMLFRRAYEGTAVYEEILRELGATDAGDNLVEVIDEEEESAVRLDELDIGNEAPVVRLVNVIIDQAVRDRASDIHIEPDENVLRVRYRVDGLLREVMTPPRRLQGAIVSRIKIMADMDIAERRVPQDGRIKLRVHERNVDLRISTLPGIYGEKVVIRLLDQSTLVLGMEQLGFAPRTQRHWEELVTRPYGVILVTGPTGSGKTTTLYATLSRLNDVHTNLVTVEDPVEYRLEGVHQVQVNPKAGITFASGLRSIFRQDPDIIMVGEMRDLETAQISVRAALTGHLVFSTLHTNDAPGAITRLLDMGIPPYLVASSLVAVLAQRLVRVLCPACAEPYEPEENDLRLAGLARDPELRLRRPVGCGACGGTGYKGRVGIFELMTMTDEIRAAVARQQAVGEIKRLACSRGMETLWEQGLRLVRAGRASLPEIRRQTQEAPQQDAESQGGEV